MTWGAIKHISRGFWLWGTLLLLSGQCFAEIPPYRQYETEYLLSPWYRGEALAGLVPTILPKGNGAPLILASELFHAIGAEFSVARDGEVQGRRHPGNLPFTLGVDGRIQLGGHQWTVPTEDFRRVNSDLYVSSDQLSRVFPLTLTPDVRHQKLKIIAAGKLPIDLQRERERRRNQALSNDRKFEASVEAFPYQGIGRLAGDLNLDASKRYETQTGVESGKRRVSYDGLLASEFMYHTGLLFFRGGSDGLSDARLRFGRESVERNAWGVEGLSQGYLGDVNAPALPLIGTMSGRGVSLSSFPLDRADQFDQVLLEGDAPIGWEVELYRGDELLAFGEVTKDGRYRFDDVPLLFGENELRVLLIGPDGQIRERTRHYTVGGNMAPPGRFDWRLFAGQHERRVLEAALYDNPPERPETSDEVYAVEGELGISRNLTMGVFASRTPIGYGPNPALIESGGGSIRGAFQRMAVEFDAAEQKGGGSAWGGGGSMRVGLANLTWRHNEYDDFLSRRAIFGAVPLARESRLRLNTRVGTWATSLYGSGEWREFTNDLRERTGAVGARFRVGGVNLTQEIEQREKYSGGDRTSTRKFWRPAASMNVGGWRLYVDGRYDLDENTLRSAKISSSWWINDSTSLTLGANQFVDFQGDPIWTGSAAFSHRFDGLGLRLSFSQLQDKGYYAGVGLNLSFGMDRRGGVHFSSSPLALRGAADIRVYHDRNNNGTFDQGADQPVSDAAIQLGEQRVIRERTDDQGRLLLNGLETNRPVSLSVVPESMPDPFLTPANGKATFVSRPGQPFPVEFALVDSGEVSGSVEVERNGQVVGLAGVTLLLERLRVVEEGAEGAKMETHMKVPASELKTAYIDSRLLGAQKAGPWRTEVMATVKTQYDGAFLFDLVPPGHYQVRIADGQYVEDHVLEPASVYTEVSQNSRFTSGINLTLLAPEDRQKRPTILSHRFGLITADSVVASDNGEIERIPQKAQLVMGSYRNLELARERAEFVHQKIGMPIWLVKVTLNDGVWYRVATVWLRNEVLRSQVARLRSSGMDFWVLREMAAQYEVVDGIGSE